MSQDLESYLADVKKRREDPEYRKSMGEDRLAESGSNARNALAAALMQSASKFGTIGGKSPSADENADFADRLGVSNRQFYGSLAAEDKDREGRLEKMYSQLSQKRGEKQEYLDAQGNRRVGIWQNGQLVKSDQDPTVEMAKKEKPDYGSWSPAGQVDEEGNMLLVNNKTGQIKKGPKLGKKETEGKPVASEVAQRIGTLDAASQQVDQLESDWRNKTGVFSGFTQFAPGTDAAQYRDSAKLAAQGIGQIIEGGKLTDSDYDRYLGMMPTAGDSKERAQEKFDRLRNYIVSRKKTSIEGARQAGYNTAGFTDTPTPKPSNLSTGTATAAPKKDYKAGDERTIGGKRYKMNDKGTWNEVK